MISTAEIPESQKSNWKRDKVSPPRCAILFFLGSLFLFQSDISAQQYTFVQYSTKQGLPQSQVRCLFQDERGFIWAGTLGGLSRFDGRDFVNYDRQDGLLNNQVNCIATVSSGELTVGTVGGISFINAVGIKSHELPSGFRESSVNCIYEIANNEFWIGTDDGLFIFRNGEMKTPEVKFPFAKSSVKQIGRDNLGNLMVASKDALYRQTGNSFTEVYRPPEPDGGIFDFGFYGDELFVATKGSGLVSINGNDTTIYSGDQGLHASTITKLEIHGDNIWLATRFGFYKFFEGTFTSFTEKNGLSTSDVRDVLADSEGNIWLATYGSGLIKFTGEQFKAYTTSEGLSSNAVMSITQDKTGAMWFSTFDNGICRMENDSIVKYDLRNFSSNNRTWSSLCDNNGTLWFGTSDGLYSFDGSEWKHFTEENGLPDKLVLSLFADNKTGTLLAGTARGLCYMNPQNPVEFIALDDVLQDAPSTRVRGIISDRAGKIWMATRDGVMAWHNDEIEIYSEFDGLPDNSIQCVEVDQYNNIWVGTQNGLAIFSSGKFKTILVDETSAANAVNFLKFHSGKLVAGTNNGMYSLEIDPKPGQDKYRFHHYTEEDGLRSLELNLNAVFEDNRGNLWLGTTEGVMQWTDKDRQTKELRPPAIVLLNIQLNLQDVDWEKRKAATNVLTGLPENLVVGYKDNHFTFHFTGLSSTYPEDILYQYKLDGFDQDWNTTTAQFATYSNLSFGEFTFRAKAVGKNGVAGAEEIFRFTILAPFWLKWWFILLEVIAVGAVVSAIWYSRRKITIAKHEKEKFELRSRLLALEQQSLNSSMNRHFIFNALNSIQYYINRQDRLAANRYLTDFAKLIRKNLDSSQDNLTSLRDEIERLELYLKLEHMRFRDKFEYEIKVDESLDTDTTRVPAMLLQPFLENSIWHGLLPKETQGKVSVDIRRSNGSIHFVITDNGIGIENSLKNKNGSEGHISKGMAIASGRIDLIKKMTDQHIELRGPHQIHDDAGLPGGTKVEIILPAEFQELF